MQITTSYRGTELRGVVLTHTPYFLEVAITSPVSKLITSRTIPSFDRTIRRFEGEMLAETCDDLLIELYEIFDEKRTDSPTSIRELGEGNSELDSLEASVETERLESSL